MKSVPVVIPKLCLSVVVACALSGCPPEDDPSSTSDTGQDAAGDTSVGADTSSDSSDASTADTDENAGFAGVFGDGAGGATADACSNLCYFLISCTVNAAAQVVHDSCEAECEARATADQLACAGDMGDCQRVYDCFGVSTEEVQAAIDEVEADQVTPERCNALCSTLIACPEGPEQAECEVDCPLNAAPEDLACAENAPSCEEQLDCSQVWLETTDDFSMICNQACLRLQSCEETTDFDACYAECLGHESEPYYLCVVDVSATCDQVLACE